MEIAKRYGAFGIKFTGDVTINGPMIDIHDNGRVYVHTEKMGSTVDQECDEEWEAVRLKFFDLPGILKRMNQQESGNKRYKPYSELLRREADSWFVFDGSLPPINEMVYKPCFGCTEDQFRRSSKIIKDLYRRLKDI